ncbi:transcription termination factor MTEF1, chloroplastic [Corylus avellana]|uniref:transcription termination factor MTEF1, chloroplastic n=1 Tax=Corylus avellana TaxID=13451 RepID=UPI00286C80AB|nr:transcription termination factor MTEF1, chloroplastic [Corylus avellana]
MLHSLSLTTLSSSSPAKTPTPNSLSPSPTPKPLYLKFRTSYRDNLRYLRALRILNPATKNNKKPPSPDDVNHVLATVDFLKSKGFTDPDFARLAFLCPLLFSSTFEPTDVAPVFDFLSADLSASPEQSRGLILRCPRILFSDVEFCLRPTLNYLKQLGVEDLSSPTNLNAHLLNTRTDRLRTKIGFLRSIGFSHEEATRACVRLPAIFGYSIDNNLWPKYIYLVDEMERSVEELIGFPQYFGFSLEKRIAPRHLHLKERNVHLPLNRMLLWGDQKFFAKWK